MAKELVCFKAKGLLLYAMFSCELLWISRLIRMGLGFWEWPCIFYFRINNSLLLYVCVHVRETILWTCLEYSCFGPLRKFRNVWQNYCTEYFTDDWLIIYRIVSAYSVSLWIPPKEEGFYYNKRFTTVYKVTENRCNGLYSGKCPCY